MLEKYIEKKLVAEVKKMEGIAAICQPRFRWDARPHSAFTTWEDGFCRIKGSRKETSPVTDQKNKAITEVRLYLLCH